MLIKKLLCKALNIEYKPEVKFTSKYVSATTPNKIKRHDCNDVWLYFLVDYLEGDYSGAVLVVNGVYNSLPAYTISKDENFNQILDLIIRGEIGQTLELDYVLCSGSSLSIHYITAIFTKTRNKYEVSFDSTRK